MLAFDPVSNLIASQFPAIANITKARQQAKSNLHQLGLALHSSTFADPGKVDSRHAILEGVRVADEIKKGKWYGGSSMVGSSPSGWTDFSWSGSQYSGGWSGQAGGVFNPTGFPFDTPLSSFNLPGAVGGCKNTGFLIQVPGTSSDHIGNDPSTGPYIMLFGGTNTNQGSFSSSSIAGMGTYQIATNSSFTFNGSGGTFEGFQESSSGSLAGNQLNIVLNFQGGTPAGYQESVTTTPLATAACTEPGAAGDDISTLTGEVYLQFDPDLDLGGGPLRLNFARYYASLLSFNGITSALGTNWMHNFDTRLVVYNSGADATVVRFTGKTVRFHQTGGVWQLANPDRYADQLVQANGEYHYYSIYDNVTYAYDANGNLIRIQDRNGNQITVTPGPNGPTQASDGLGRTLTFTYSGTSLTKVTDQSGRFVTVAQTGGNLTALTDANGKTTNYTYTSAPTGSVLVTTTLPLGNNLYTQTYDTFGRVTKQTDGLGNALTLAYTTAGGGSTVTDALANKSSYGYNSLLASSYTDGLGNAGSIAYDANTRPTSVTDRNGNKRSTTYAGASGLPASFTDEDGNTTTLTYSASSSGGITAYDLTGVTYADGTSVSYVRDANGNLTKLTDEGGNATNYTYNSRGQPLTIVNALGGTTTLTYNTDGTVASAQTPAGDTTTFTYDTLKRLTQVKHPDATTLSLAYDSLDRVTQVTDERGKVTKVTFDDNGKENSTTDALGNVTNFTYDAAENLTAIKPPPGTTTESFNADELVNTITAPTGETRTFGYDADLRATTASDAGGQFAAIAYDNEAGMTSFTDGASRKFTFTPDALGLLTVMKMPGGETWQQTFDKRTRLSSSTDAAGGTSTYTYEPRSYIASASLPGGITGSYVRNPLGQVSSTTDPNGNNWSRAYDTTGRKTSETDPLGNKVSYTYDSRNRIITESYGSAGSVQITYDAANNQTGRAYSDSTNLTYTFDDDGRLTGGTGVTLTLDALGFITNSNGLAIGRDASERINSITYAPGKVTYTYNNRGLLSQVSDWAGGSVSFTYNGALQPTSIARSNGVTTRYTYDADGRLISITESAGNNTLSSVSLTRDSLGRITGETRTQPQAVSIAAGVSSYTYDVASQVSGSTYDFLGRLTKDSFRNYVYDGASRLTSYTGTDGAASFTYDAFGMRISRTSSGTTQLYTIDYATGLPTVAVVQLKNGASATDQRYYVYAPNGAPLYWIDASGSAHHFLHYDQMGNAVILTGDNGAVTDSYGITPYGESVTQSGSTQNPFTWQGASGYMQEGSTSLYFARARYYDSATARFISRDPVHNPSPRVIDPYQYALGDPVDFFDPSGLNPLGTPTVTMTPGSPLSGSGQTPHAPPVIAANRDCHVEKCFGFWNSCSATPCTNPKETCKPDVEIDFGKWRAIIQHCSCY
jgi:RHS repeat-associated protein